MRVPLNIHLALTIFFLAGAQFAHPQGAAIPADGSAGAQPQGSADAIFPDVVKASEVPPALAGLFSLSEVAAADEEQAPSQAPREKRPVDSELIVEGEGSFGHYHIFAYSWWSELYTGGIEYDRHTWNYFLKSQMDYVAEILPVTILRQPTDTDVFGDPLSQARFINPGLGIYPVGLRMKWRYDKGWQPYFIIKGGMLFFAQKALSKDAAHQNFSLQMGIGMQRRLTKRFDVRTGYEDIHFSDAFVVPSNPGLDVMAYDGGIVYHLGK
ncbi:MAG TPA: hypothetical protein VGG56_01645 [Terracidiphilus sp.]